MDCILIDGEGFIKLTDFGLSEINLNNIKKQYEDTLKHNSDMEPILSDDNESDPEMPQISLSNLLSFEQNTEVNRKLAKDNKIKLSQDLSKIKCKALGKKQNDDQRKLLGTPDYIAPEAILGKEITKAVDWWALGVIALEFMTGSLPFNDISPEKKYFKIL